MLFNVTYDSSVGAAPSWFKSTVKSALNVLGSVFTNPITVNLSFGWGEDAGHAIASGNAAQSSLSGNFFNYKALRSALASHATSSDDKAALSALGTADPTNGGQFLVPFAEQKALGLLSATGSEMDGYVGLSSAVNWAPAGSGAIGTTQHDAMGSIEHEVTEIMGRIGALKQSGSFYGPMDLFRYSSPGHRDLTPGAGSFSVDGRTLLTAFNNPLQGGDAADWASSVVGDAFGGSYNGVKSPMSATDLRVMDLLGYTKSPNAGAIASGTAPASSSSVSLAAGAVSAAGGTAKNAADADPTASDPYRLETGTGPTTYVFQPHPGHTVVSNFAVAGADHQDLSLPSSAFASIADILFHTTASGHGAVIHLSPTDTITLAGVSVSALSHHAGDLRLHA